jgi:hypothetical protein
VVFEPFQLTIASELKPLPLTVKVNAGLPAFALFGTSSVITGMAPGCGGGAIELPYPPHPEISIANNNTEIVFMTFSNRALTRDVLLLLKRYKALFPRSPTRNIGLRPQYGARKRKERLLVPGYLDGRPPLKVTNLT